ncbi:MAG: hypothetical protein FWE38_03980 [Firmicutes bacterium]|nr:hypothetical protein [Bacillota bacterium]
MRDEFAILHFDGSKMAMAVGTRVGANFSIKRQANLDYSGILDGEFVEPAEMPGLLAQLTKKVTGQLRTTTLTIEVPAMFCRVFVDTITDTFERPRRVTKRDIDRVMKRPNEHLAEAAGMVPVHMDIMYWQLDGARPQLNPDGATATELFAKRSVIFALESFVSIIRNALVGLPFTDVEFVPAPLSRALYLIDEESRDAGCRMLHCDMFSTTVVSVAGDNLSAIHTVPLGMAHVANDLCVVLECDYPVARGLMGALMLNLTPSDGDELDIAGERFDTQLVGDIVRARLSEIAEGILDATGDGKMYICGGGISAIRGGRDFLSRELNIPLVQTFCPRTAMADAEDPAIHAILKRFRG